MTNSDHYTLSYDGSFEGFLSCVFQVYERKIERFTIIKNGGNKNGPFVEQSTLFSIPLHIITDHQQADRVWNGLRKRVGARDARRIYAVFLSEQPDIEDVLLQYIKYALSSANPIAGDFTNPYVMRVSKVAKMVSREVHRMHAFVRFKLTKDNIYYAQIEPDFDVVPLISRHFEERYADQQWLIYDIHRNYGIYYDLQKVETIQLELNPGRSHPDQAVLLEDELDFQQLWKDYFQSTNIASRKNMKLHLQHVPKRYWKFLSEKQA